MADTDAVTPTNGEQQKDETTEKDAKITKGKTDTDVAKETEKKDKEENEEDEKEDGSTNEEDKMDDIKEEDDVELTPELERKIIRQIEFYFGDLNLARDRFMQEEIKQNDGWLTMKTMLRFNRLYDLCPNSAKIVEAAKKSTSGLLEFSEDNKRVRRNPSKPVPNNTEERRKDLKSRTCYAKHFPITYKMGDLLDFFDKHCCTELIQMRRNNKRQFKGSVFVVFPTQEEAQKFLALEEMRVTEDCEPLLKLLKEDYFTRKGDQKSAKPGAEDNKEKAEKETAAKEAAIQEEEKIMRDRMTKGAILHLVGIASDTTREDLKAAFGGEESKIAWVDFDKGDSDAWLRFDEENGAQKAWDKFSTDDKITINDSEIRADVLEGEVEFNHWKNIFQTRVDRQKKGGRGGGRGGRGGRGRGGGGGWRGKGRKSGGGDDGPRSKRTRH